MVLFDGGVHVGGVLVEAAEGLDAGLVVVFVEGARVEGGEEVLAVFGGVLAGAVDFQDFFVAFINFNLIQFLIIKCIIIFIKLHLLRLIRILARCTPLPNLILQRLLIHLRPNHKIHTLIFLNFPQLLSLLELIQLVFLNKDIDEPIDKDCVGLLAVDFVEVAVGIGTVDEGEDVVSEVDFGLALELFY